MTEISTFPASILDKAIDKMLRVVTAKLYACLRSPYLEDSGLKLHSPPKVLKSLFGLAFSPIDSYKGMRRRLKAKLNPRRMWDRMWERLRKDDVPF
ncbi:MAG: hypothetical protein QXV73_05780 [Candidatus Micrarchaeia archaeon]